MNIKSWYTSLSTAASWASDQIRESYNGSEIESVINAASKAITTQPPLQKKTLDSIPIPPSNLTPLESSSFGISKLKDIFNKTLLDLCETKAVSFAALGIGQHLALSFYDLNLANRVSSCAFLGTLLSWWSDQNSLAGFFLGSASGYLYHYLKSPPSGQSFLEIQASRLVARMTEEEKEAMTRVSCGNLLEIDKEALSKKTRKELLQIAKEMNLDPSDGDLPQDIINRYNALQENFKTFMSSEGRSIEQKNLAKIYAKLPETIEIALYGQTLGKAISTFKKMTELERFFLICCLTCENKNKENRIPHLERMEQTFTKGMQGFIRFTLASIIGTNVWAFVPNFYDNHWINAGVKSAITLTSLATLETLFKPLTKSRAD